MIKITWSLTKILKKSQKNIHILIKSKIKIEEILALLLLLVLILELKKIYLQLYTLIIIKKNTTPKTALSLKKYTNKLVSILSNYALINNINIQIVMKKTLFISYLVQFKIK